MLAVLLPALAARGAEGPVLIDGVVAQVGSEVILASEVEEQVALLRLRANLPDTSVEQARADILQSIIDEKIVVQEARARGMTVTAEEVERAVTQHVDAIRQQMGGEEAFARQLAQENLTEAELIARYRDDARREILTSRLVQREVYSKIEIADAEVKRYYEEHRAELPQKPGEVELAHVFIGLKPKPEALARAQEKLDRIGRRLAAGEPFERIAREDSDDKLSRDQGGDLGWFAPGELEPRLASTVESLAPGEISEPFQVPQGVEIVRLTARDSERVRLAHIQVAIEIDDGDRRRAREEAEKVLRLARGGADFGVLADEYSDDRESAEKGGNLGRFDDAELNPVVARAVRGLAAGELSNVVASEAGLHIFKVLAREGGGDFSYDEIKERLRGRMLEERAAELTDQWIKELRSKYFVRRAEHPPSPPEPGSPGPGVRAVIDAASGPAAPAPADTTATGSARRP